MAFIPAIAAALPGAASSAAGAAGAASSAAGVASSAAGVASSSSGSATLASSATSSAGLVKGTQAAGPMRPPVSQRSIPSVNPTSNPAAPAQRQAAGNQSHKASNPAAPTQHQTVGEKANTASTREDRRNSTSSQSDLDSGAESDNTCRANDFLAKQNWKSSKPSTRWSESKPVSSQSEAKSTQNSGISQIANEDFIDNHLRPVPKSGTLEDAAIDVHRDRWNSGNKAKNNTTLFYDNKRDAVEDLRGLRGAGNNPDAKGLSDLRPVEDTSFTAVQTYTKDGVKFDHQIVNAAKYAVAHNKGGQTSHLEKRV